MSLSPLLQEAVVLSFLFNSSTDDIKKYINKLNENYFTDYKTKKIFKVFKNISDNNLVLDKLIFKKIYEELDGYPIQDNELNEFYSCIVNENFDYHYAQLLKNYVNKSIECVNIVGDSVSDIYLSLKKEFDRIRNVFPHEESQNIIKTDELIKRSLDHFEDLLSNPPKIPSYINSIDRIATEMLRRGKLSVWAARPSTGKSTLWNNIIKMHAIHGKYKILYLPLEDGVDSTIENIISSKSSIPIKDIVEGNLSKLQIEKYKKGLNNFLYKNNNIFFSDKLFTIDSIYKELSINDYDVCVIDLFERLRDIRIDPGDLSEKLRYIQHIAHETDTHIAIVHQIKRQGTVKPKPPSIHELKNSGSYEETANLIVGLHTFPYFYKNEKIDVLQSIILKQKKGSNNIWVYNKFEKEYLRILSEVEMKSKSDNDNKNENENDSNVDLGNIFM